MTSTAQPQFRASVALVAGLAFALSACGNTDPVAVDGSDGTPYKVSATASFPTEQQVANQQALKITVRNEEASRTIPDVAVVVRGLERKLPAGDNGNGKIADRRRPVWIVDEPPAGGPTELSSTWALGPLPAGEERTFTWKLTPVVAGEHEIVWSVAGDLAQDGPVEATGGDAEGAIDVTVAR
jgi:hypothetical protein